MLPLKKILFPTDFSEPSYEALKAANELALHFSSQLLVLHVIHPFPIVPAEPAPTFNVSQVLQEMETSATQALQTLVEEKVKGSIKTSTFTIHGNPADEIVQLADEERVDVIVIATHGLTGWRRLVFGSVAERVVRQARCPVLTICAPSEV